MPAGSSSYSLGGLWIVQPLPIHICQEKSHDNPACRNFLNPKILWQICRFRSFCFNTARNLPETCEAWQNVPKNSPCQYWALLPIWRQCLRTFP